MAEPMPNESYDWDAARERLKDEADRDYPPAWLPEPGDEIVGMVVDVNPAAHTAYGPVPVVTLEGPNGGRRSVWLMHSVLRRAFVRADVQLGEVVLVRYVGKVQPEGGGNAWADYRVVVDRETRKGGPDWRAIAERHRDDLDDANGHRDVEPERELEHAAAGAADADDIPF